MRQNIPERREHLRIPVAARVKFREGDREEIWLTRDLSEGGLFLKTEKPPFVGTLVDLEISLPDTPELVKGRGEVVWRYEGEGCGVRFVRLTAQMKQRIREFVKSAEFTTE